MDALGGGGVLGRTVDLGEPNSSFFEAFVLVVQILLLGEWPPAASVLRGEAWHLLGRRGARRTAPLRLRLPVPSGCCWPGRYLPSGEEAPVRQPGR